MKDAFLFRLVNAIVFVGALLAIFGSAAPQATPATVAQSEQPAAALSSTLPPANSATGHLPS